MKQVKNIFQELKGKRVKVIIKDIDKIHFIRGVLSEANKDFILIKGDFSEQIVLISTILKITHNLEGEQNVN
jgi:transcription antitermination factor NusA-like protein